MITLLGIWGWLSSTATESPRPTGWGRDDDALYRALQIFTLNYDHPDLAKGWHADWALDLARFLAPLFLVIALVVNFSRTIVNFFVRIYYAIVFQDEQFLVVGYGRVGQGLASALKTQNSKSRVIAIDRHATALDKEAAAVTGVELYEADVREIESLQHVPISIGRLKKILVSLGNDQVTIASAAQLLAQYPEETKTIWMQLNDWSLLDGLRNSSSLGETLQHERKIRSFSMAEALGTQLITKYRPTLMAKSFGQNRLHAVLVRFDDFVWAMAEALVLNGTSPPPRLSRPRLTIIDAKAQVLRERWTARHPHLGRWADINFIAADPSALAWSNGTPLLTIVETLDPPTLYLFGRSGDGDALTDALSLRHGMSKGIRQAAPIFITSEVEGIEKLGLQIHEANLQDRLEIIGADAEIALYSHVTDPWFEKLSENFFRAYRRENPPKDKAGKPVKETNEDIAQQYLAQAETFQVSNRRAAIHALQILAWLGFEQVDAIINSFGLTADSAGQLRALFTTRPDHLQPGCKDWKEIWALFEHMRWCVDRAVDGWSQGPRDDEARLRDQMERGRYDYHRLEIDEITKDLSQAETTADLLAGAPPPNGKICPRIESAGTPLALEWYFAGDTLALRLRDGQNWPDVPAQAGLHLRVRLLVPAEPCLVASVPAMAGQNPKYAAVTPAVQKNARKRAYGDFVATLPRDKRLHFRLLRNVGQGSEWLGDYGIPLVDGCTLPPLTVGFTGARDLASLGDMTQIQAALRTLLNELCAEGRPMRLITGAAAGADRLMIDLWQAHEIARQFPMILLYPEEAGGQTGQKITELVLHNTVDKTRLLQVAREQTESASGDTIFEEISERILNVCDVLLAGYHQDAGQRPGGSRTTAERAEKLGIKVHHIPLPTLVPA